METKQLGEQRERKNPETKPNPRCQQLELPRSAPAPHEASKPCRAREADGSPGPAAPPCQEGSDAPWLLQDHPCARGWLELGKPDQAVVQGPEGRRGCVGWDISSSLEHSREQPPCSEASPGVKEVTPRSATHAPGLPGSSPRTSIHPHLQSTQPRQKRVLSCARQAPDSHAPS